MLIGNCRDLKEPSVPQAFRPPLGVADSTCVHSGSCHHTRDVHACLSCKNKLLTFWCPSMKGQTTSLTWGERPGVALAAVRGWSGMITLGQLARGIQGLWHKPGPALLVLQVSARRPGCMRTLLCAPTLQHSHSSAVHWHFPLLGTFQLSPSPALSTSSALSSAHPSTAAQPRLAPWQCWPQGAAVLWALTPPL